MTAWPADKRILPEGWVKYSATPTPNAWVGQGAGFWTNLGDSFGATYRTEHGWPRDAFFAKGTIGQYVIIVPSERLVIVRLGRSPNWPPEADGVFDLVRDVVAATGEQGKAGGSELTRRGGSFPFSPCGRRWREAPDEGFYPRSTIARDSLVERTPHPSRMRFAHSIHPLPQGERGAPSMRPLACSATAAPTAWPSRRDRISPATGSRRRAGRRGRSAPGGRA